MPQSLRVVIADDESDILQYYRAILGKLGHAVVAEARDGHEIVEHCHELKPDLVISDIAMPGLDGITALEKVCAWSKTPFIFVTGSEDAGMRQRVQRQQVLACLMKPVKGVDLASALGRITG